MGIFRLPTELPYRCRTHKGLRKTAPRRALEHASALFLTDAEDRECSPQTITYYRRVLRSFEGWCADQDIAYLEHIDRQTVRAYVQYVRTRPSRTKRGRLNVGGVNSYLRGIKAFFNFCRREELVPHSVDS
jgi:site-specific recombinase XerD